jgi:phosphonate transport system substrate-binding protein
VNKGDVKFDEFLVLWQSDPIPQDPFVYRNTLCQDIRDNIKETFLGLKDQPNAKKFLANVKSNTFVPMTSKDYDIIRTLKKAKDEKKKSN